MKRVLTTMMLLLSLLALSSGLGAQDNIPAHPRYKVIDLGTLGGTFTGPGGINIHSEVEGFATLPGDTEQNAFFWSRGIMTAIPGLGGPNSAAGWAISDRGQVGAGGDTGQPDPLAEDFCAFGTTTICLPFVWQRGNITVLPLPAGNNGVPTGFNNRDEVTGKVEQADIDPNCQLARYKTQGIVWKSGRIERLLPNYPGDTQGAGHSINDLSQAVGWSGNCLGPPFHNHALLWDRGQRIDLGSIGGTSGQGYNINNRTEVVGFSRVAAGPRHGFLWRNGKMSDLGVLPGDISSEALAINDQGEIVGSSTDTLGNERAVLWCHGTIIDLNTLVTGSSPLYLMGGEYINAKGEIVGIGLDSTSGEIRGFLARPLASDDDDETAPAAGATNPARPFVPQKVQDQLNRRSLHRHMGAEDEEH